MFAKPKAFILASGSPRRSKLLLGLNLSFKTIPADIDESILDGESADQYVERLSNAKSRVVSEQYQDSLVLGADTSVVLEDEILGKPRDHAEAREMLSRLQGRVHKVLTGFTLRHAASGRSITVHEVTEVTFGAVNTEEIAIYVDSGSPMDKAGSYGIQDDKGCLFIESIKGDYYNVVGLPLRRFYTCMKEHFPDYPIMSSGSSIGCEMDNPGLT